MKLQACAWTVFALLLLLAYPGWQVAKGYRAAREADAHGVYLRGGMLRASDAALRGERRMDRAYADRLTRGPQDRGGDLWGWAFTMGCDLYHGKNPVAPWFRRPSEAELRQQEIDAAARRR